MERFRDNLPITLAAVLSLLLHVFVLFPALGLMGSVGAWSSESIQGAALDAASEPASDEMVQDDTASKDAQDQRANSARSERLERQRAAESARRALQERRNRDRALPREEQEEVRLGIAESNAVTMNWIGYDEYQEHLAELSEVEQAAYRLAEASGSNGTSEQSLAPAPPAPSAAVSPNPSPLPLPAASGLAATGELAASGGGVTNPTEAKAATPPSNATKTDGSDSERARPTETAPATEPTAQPVVATPQPEIAPDPVPDPQTEPRTDPTVDPVTPVEPVQPVAPLPEPVAPTPLDPATPGMDPTATPRETTEPSPNPAERPTDAVEPRPTPPLPESQNPATSSQPNTTASEPNANPDGTQVVPPSQQGGGIPGDRPINGAAATPSQPSPKGKQSDNPSAAGEVSDRESDATSTIRVDQIHWRNGKPLAAKGLTLKPARPRFTTLNIVDGIGRNPIAELQFGRDGVPQVARLVRSTGNPGVDDSIRAALFKWRAAGPQLEKLKPGQTVTIKLQLIMLAD